jgi:tRNA A-37 threonylcarbamoyl transferase component Bud32
MHTNYQQFGDLFIHNDYIDLLKDAGLDDFDALMQVEGEKSLDKNKLAKWRKRIVLKCGQKTLFLKRYDKPALKEQLRQRLQGYISTASAEWYWIQKLQQLNINAPVAVAFGKRTKGLIESQSLLITEHVPGESLRTYVKDPAFIEQMKGYHFKQKLIKAVADFVREFHAHGLYHRDLYLTHVFAKFANESGAELSVPEITVIDLQRIIKPWLTLRWRVKDIAGLQYSTPDHIVSKTDRIRWFKLYRNTKKLTLADRSLMRIVYLKAKHIARHSKKHDLG